MTLEVCAMGFVKNNFSWEMAHLWRKCYVDKQNTSILFSSFYICSAEEHRGDIQRQNTEGS